MTHKGNLPSQPLVSIIVPIYNVEKYLKKCIESILEQNYQNLEIFLVNDGSEDGCLEICIEYSKSDKRICVLDKQNGGLSDARNYALDKISGEYVTFVDSDDFISPDYVETLYNLCIKYHCQISCVGKYDYINGEVVNNNKLEPIEKLLSKKDAIKCILVEKEFTTSAWGKLYESKLFKNIRYPKGQLYEDLSTTYRLLDKVDTVGYSNSPKYYYRNNPNSIMNAKFTKKNMDFIKAHEDIIKYVEKFFPQLKKDAKNRLTRYACAFLVRIYTQNYKSYGEEVAIRNIIKVNLSTFLRSKYSIDKKLFAIGSIYAPYLTKKISILFLR